MRQRFLILIEIVAFSLLCSVPVRAEFEYRAEVTAAQEYNSNVNENAKPKGDFVTIMSAAVAALYAGNRLNAAVDYHGSLRLYDTGQRQDEIINDLEAKATLQVVKDLLVLDVSDSNHMTYYNATRGQTMPADSTVDQVNQNILNVGLALTPRISDRTTLKIGYLTTAALYDSSNAVNKFTQTGFADLLHELTPRFEIGGSLQYQRQETTEGDLSRYLASVVGRYTYGDGCYVFARAGGIQTTYNIGGSNLLPYGSAGINHTIGRTAFLLQAQADYVENPSSIYNSYRTVYSATITRTIKRGMLSAYVGYSDYSGRDTTHSRDLTTTVQAQYDLTPRLSTLLSASRIGTMGGGDSSDRYYGMAELRYQLPKDASVKLYYQLKVNQSEERGQSSYNVNILGLALSKSF